MRILVNDEYSTEVRFTQEQVNLFAQISGDCNPIHVDPEYAKKSVFGRTIIHGFLSASVFSKVFGMEWPGEGTIYLSQTMKFKAPVFVNESYIANLKCIDVDMAKHRGLIRCMLNDKNGNILIEGDALIKHDSCFV